MFLVLISFSLSSMLQETGYIYIFPLRLPLRRNVDSVATECVSSTVTRQTNCGSLLTALMAEKGNIGSHRAARFSVIVVSVMQGREEN